MYIPSFSWPVNKTLPIRKGICFFFFFFVGFNVTCLTSGFDTNSVVVVVHETI